MCKNCEKHDAELNIAQDSTAALKGWDQSVKLIIHLGFMGGKKKERKITGYKVSIHWIKCQ